MRKSNPQYKAGMAKEARESDQAERRFMAKLESLGQLAEDGWVSVARLQETLRMKEDKFLYTWAILEAEGRIEVKERKIEGTYFDFRIKYFKITRK